MSPKRFSITIMSNEFGLMTSFIAAASMMQSSTQYRETIRQRAGKCVERGRHLVEDVRLVYAGHAFSPLTAGRLESEAGDAFRRSFGDDA